MPGPVRFPFVKWKRSQRCPCCDESLSAEEINIKEGVALCPACGTLSRLSELNFSHRTMEEILSKPSPGCSIDSDGHRVVITASLRSVGGFLATGLFALFWNGIVSIFLLMAFASLYANLIGPLPAWFPAPDMKNGKPQMNGQDTELGMTLFLFVFLSPFVAVGIGMTGATLMYLIGKVEVVLDELDSYVYSGIGFIKWKTRFDPNEVRTVRFTYSEWQSEGSPTRSIELSGNPTVKFGSLLQLERMEWMMAVLKVLFRQRYSQLPRNSTIPEVPWLKLSPEAPSSS